jgi:DNA-binding NtrC family response regulator
MSWSESMYLFNTLRKMKILLIDDDEWIRGSLQLFFETEGCQLIALETAEQGLAALRENTYDIIIVDYKLPGKDGIEFLKQIRNAHSDAIKILITAYKSEALVSEAKKLDIQGFIEKPLTSETFFGSLSYLVNKRKKREEIHAK